MKIAVSLIDRANNNRELLTERSPIEDPLQSIVVEWEPWEMLITDGVKIAISASQANGLGNLTLQVTEDGEPLFNSHFGINELALIRAKSKTGEWLEFVVEA